jgi:hypothetical protein
MEILQYLSSCSDSQYAVWCMKMINKQNLYWHANVARTYENNIIMPIKSD